MLQASYLILETQIPDSLTPREVSFSWIVGILLFASVAIMALARSRQSSAYYAVAVGMIKTQSVREFLRELMPLRSGASILLLVNYLISGGLLVHLIATYYQFGTIQSWILAVILPGAILSFHFFSLLLSGWITGEPGIFRTPIAMKIIGTQVLGIIYFVCATFWILQPDFLNITLQVVVWVFFAESAFRILKSVSVVLRQGVTWYYIILYFCTLEILPFLLVYYFGWRDLVR